MDGHSDANGPVKRHALTKITNYSIVTPYAISPAEVHGSCGLWKGPGDGIGTLLDAASRMDHSGLVNERAPYS